MKFDEIENFLKVQKPLNDCLQISQSIELKRSEKYGRMIVAREDLLPGDVIAIEEPFFISLDKNGNQKRCAFCLKENVNQVCEGCQSISFCSESCKNLHWIWYHKYECENFEEIDYDDNFLLMMNRMLFKSLMICETLSNLNTLICSINESLTIFDLNNLEDEKKVLACCFNLECGNIDDDFLFIDHCVGSPFLKQFISSENDVNVLKTVILRILGILNRNSFTLNFKSKDTAGAIYPFGSLINHSCSPNLEKINIGSKSIYICNQPIIKSSQLFLCYRRPFYFESKDKRQRSLYRQFNFKCECKACLDDKYLQFSRISLKEFRQIESINEYKANCKLITENYNTFPCYEIIQAIYENKKFLQVVLDEY